MDLKNFSFKNYGAVTVRFEFNSSTDVLDPLQYFSSVQNILYEGIPKELMISDFELRDIRDFLKIFDLPDIDIESKLSFKISQNMHSILNSSFSKEDISINIHQWSVDKKMMLESFHIKNSNPALTKMFFDILCFCKIQVIPHQNMGYAVNKNGISVLCHLSKDMLNIYVIYDQVALGVFLTKNKYFRLNWED